MSEETPVVPPEEPIEVPGPGQGFNSEKTAQAQADGRAYKENRNNEFQYDKAVKYYVANGAEKPFDTSGRWIKPGEGDHRNQPFPVSPPVYEGFVQAMSEIRPVGGWQPYIKRKVDADGNEVKMFTREQIMADCQAEFEESTGSTKPFTQTLPNDVLEAGGINPPETPEGFGAPCPPPNEGSYWVIGYEPVGKQVERDGITYEVVQIPLMQRWDPVS